MIMKIYKLAYTHTYSECINTLLCEWIVISIKIKKCLLIFHYNSITTHNYTTFFASIKVRHHDINVYNIVAVFISYLS